MKPVETTMSNKLQESFDPIQLKLSNISYLHHVPAGSETHFNLLLVSDRFDGLRTLQRHRLVHQCLQEELKNSVHALTQKALTPSEWEALGEETRNSMNEPPQCKG